jgi:glycerol-3-phosphate acyltransferase PlsY
MFPSILLCLLAGYLLGALSFAAWIAKARGVDIFAEGSGNPGATNVKRILGPTAGNVVFVLDFLKGTAAAAAGLWIAGDPGGIAAAAAAVAGQSFSVFLRFRGGKGVAVTMGALLALMPLVLLAGIAVWLLVYFSTRIVSLASVLFAASLPLAAWGLSAWRGAPSPALIVFAAAIAVLIVLRHRSNLLRFMKGEEKSFGRKRDR